VCSCCISTDSSKGTPAKPIGTKPQIRYCVPYENAHAIDEQAGIPDGAMQLLPRVKNFMAAFDILISGAPEAGITSPHTNGVHNQDDFDTEEGSHMRRITRRCTTALQNDDLEMVMAISAPPSMPNAALVSPCSSSSLRNASWNQHLARELRITHEIRTLNNL
jgi:hypothetical protein